MSYHMEESVIFSVRLPKPVVEKLDEWVRKGLIGGKCEYVRTCVIDRILTEEQWRHVRDEGSD